MDCSLITPCTFADLAEVVPATTPLRLGMLRGQLGVGSSFALRNGLGEAVACGGYVPLEPGVVEAWFAVHPTRGPKAMRAVLRAIALTMVAGGYSAIRIETETGQGARMARLLGFERFPCETSNEVWICQP